jgi:hypothetical protein
VVVPWYAHPVLRAHARPRRVLERLRGGRRRRGRRRRGCRWGRRCRSRSGRRVSCTEMRGSLEEPHTGCGQSNGRSGHEHMLVRSRRCRRGRRRRAWLADPGVEVVVDRGRALRAVTAQVLAERTTCWICGQPARAGDELTLDHLVPRATAAPPHERTRGPPIAHATSGAALLCNGHAGHSGGRTVLQPSACRTALRENDRAQGLGRRIVRMMDDAGKPRSSDPNSDGRHPRTLLSGPLGGREPLRPARRLPALRGARHDRR